MKTYYVFGMPFSDELWHYGIKGQKWGIRRFQNEDGTLTSAGKDRYSEGGSFNDHSRFSMARGMKGTGTKARHVATSPSDSSKTKIQKNAGQKMKKLHRFGYNPGVKPVGVSVREYISAANRFGVDSSTAIDMWRSRYSNSQSVANAFEKETEKIKNKAKEFASRINGSVVVSSLNVQSQSSFKKISNFVSSCASAVVSAIKDSIRKAKDLLGRIFR